jgi:hypothetical protein
MKKMFLFLEHETVLHKRKKNQPKIIRHKVCAEKFGSMNV